MASKTCTRCGKTQSVEEFWWWNPKAKHIGNLDRVSGHRSVCKSCLRKQDHDRREQRAQSGLCRECGTPVFENHSLCTKHLKIQRERDARRKLDVFQHYGGAKCACCGVSEISFLQLDHIKNDGNTWRKAGETAGQRFYLFLQKHDYPLQNRLQVLCANCHQSKHFNNGICSHQNRICSHQNQGGTR